MQLIHPHEQKEVELLLTRHLSWPPFPFRDACHASERLYGITDQRVLAYFAKTLPTEMLFSDEKGSCVLNALFSSFDMEGFSAFDILIRRSGRDRNGCLIDNLLSHHILFNAEARFSCVQHLELAELYLSSMSRQFALQAELWGCPDVIIDIIRCYIFNRVYEKQRQHSVSSAGFCCFRHFHQFFVVEETQCQPP